MADSEPTQLSMLISKDFLEGYLMSMCLVVNHT